MSRPRRPPSYLRHRGPDGKLRARTVLRWPGGKEEHRSLGTYGSPESHALHEQLCAQWRVAWASADDGRFTPLAIVPTEALTVGDLVARYLRAQERRRQGKSELHNLVDALRPVRSLWGSLPVRDFTAAHLRAALVAGATGGYLPPEEIEARRDGGKPIGWCRRVANRHLGRMRLAWRWGEREGLVPRGTWEHLRCVEGLQEGEEGVRETGDVPPAPEADVWAVHDVSNHVIRALIELQLLTGARPGEICRLRPRDLVRSGRLILAPGIVLELGDVWGWELQQHKVRHKNKRRVILFGPRARALLAGFLDRDPGLPCFRPVEAVQRFRESKRARRKTPVQPSQHNRASLAPRRAPSAEVYTTRAYARAVRRACARLGIETWSPGQLRHLAATRLAAQFGEDVARIVLGHARIETTDFYLVRDLSKAVDAMRRVG